MSEKKVYAPDTWVNFGSTGASMPKHRLHNGCLLNESVFVFLALGDLEKSHICIAIVAFTKLSTFFYQRVTRELGL